MPRSLSIRLTGQLDRDLARASRQQHRPASEIAREALRKYLSLEELRRIREQMRPYAEARGFLTDEDIFKAAS